MTKSPMADGGKSDGDNKKGLRVSDGDGNKEGDGGGVKVGGR
jgi:hypothetical protein